MFEQTPAGLRLRVRLTPNAASDRIDGPLELSDGSRVLAARVRAVPEKGRANQSLVALLAKALDLPKKSVGIERGHTSRLKTVDISADPGQCGRLIKTLESFP